jgi:hypothetical protein
MYRAAEIIEDLCMCSFELKRIGLNRIMDWYTQIKLDLTITEAYLIFLSNLSEQNKLPNIIS